MSGASAQQKQNFPAKIFAVASGSPLSLLVLGLALLILSPVFDWTQGAVDSAGFSFDHPPAGWFANVNFNTNAFHPWRFDGLLLDLFGSLSFNWFVWLHLILFAGGFYLWMRNLDKTDTTGCAIAAAAVILIIRVYFGFDTVVLTALAWLPWLAFSLTKIGRQLKPHPFWYILLLFCSIRLAESASLLSPLLGAAALAAAFFSCDPKAERKSCLIPFGIVFLPAIYVLLSVPELNLPHYPPEARVVPDDGLPGIITPLTGPAYSLPVIDRMEVKKLFSQISLFLLATAFLSAYFEKRGHGAGFKFSLAAVFCSLFLFFDSGFFPESISQISPLAALSRMIPWLFLVPLAPIAAALAMVFLFAALCRSLRLAAAVFLVLCFAPRLISSKRVVAATPLLSSSSALKEGELRASFHLLPSPSFSVLRNTGYWIAEARKRIKALKSSPLLKYSHSLYGSGDIGHLSLAADRNGKTRWSPTAGSQNGGEWLKIVFDKPEIISGVVLSTGRYKTDFPRALKVKYTTSPGKDTGCSAPREEPDCPTIWKTDSWQGPVLFTTDGFPYYGAQSSVKVVFPRDIRATALFIEQTAREPHFDWSVAEISILHP